MQTWSLTKELRPLIDQILANTRQEQELARDPSPSETENAIRPPGSQDTTNNQTTASKRIDQVQAVLNHVLENEGPSDPDLLPEHEDVSLERELEIQLQKQGIESEATKALLEVIDRKRKQLAHSEDIDPISYTAGRNQLEGPKGWIMVVDNYNEGNSENLNRAPEALLRSLKYSPSLPKLISSLSGFGQSKTLANGSLTELSRRAFKLRLNSPNDP